MRIFRNIALSIALLIVGGVQVLADRNATGIAKLEIGQKETTKNLIYSGPGRKTDRKYIIKSYRIFASPKNAASYVFVVRQADGSTETISADEEEHSNFERIFSGVSLDLKISRISEDESYLIGLRYHLHTRIEGEDGVWR